MGLFAMYVCMYVGTLLAASSCGSNSLGQLSVIEYKQIVTNTGMCLMM